MKIMQTELKKDVASDNAISKTIVTYAISVRPCARKPLVFDHSRELLIAL